MNTLITLPLNSKLTITHTGIQFNEELSFDEWDTLGRELVPVAKSIGFIMGDWINYGENRWGQKYLDAINMTGLAYDTLRKYGYIAKRIEFGRRRPELEFSVYEPVAKIKDEAAQKYWIDVAAKEKLSVRRLRKSINYGRIATEEEVQGDPLDRGHVTYLALLNRIRRWWYDEVEKAPVENWDEERRQVLKEDFKLILDIYNAL